MQAHKPNIKQANQLRKIHTKRWESDAEVAVKNTSADRRNNCMYFLYFIVTTKEV